MGGERIADSEIEMVFKLSSKLGCTVHSTAAYCGISERRVLYILRSKRPRGMLSKIWTRICNYIKGDKQ